jgi:hypothetical protein
MRGRQFERRRHVFAGDLVQHPQSHHRALQLPESFEAADHERKVLRLSDQIVGGKLLCGDLGEGLIARLMRARDLVPAAPIPRVVSESTFDSTSCRACGSRRYVWNAS